MILGVFIEFFGIKIVFGLSKNRCDLFLTVGLILVQIWPFDHHISIRNHSKSLDQVSDLKSTIE